MMNIQQATKGASLNMQLGMRRQFWRESQLVLKPTNTKTCTEMYKEGQFLSSRWNPSEEDLTADDWEICAINVEENA